MERCCVPARRRMAASVALCVWFVSPARLGRVVDTHEVLAADLPMPPIFAPQKPPAALETQFLAKNFKFDKETGNYLSPKVSARSRHDEMVPVLIGGRYVKDLRGNTVFLRKSIRDRLLKADAAMFAKKKKHLAINYGFRSNQVQADLYKKIAGKGKVAVAGGSFHEAGMALDLNNWHDAQPFMIEAGFVGGCYGIEEDMVHYSIDEVTKASNMAAFKRCTLKEIPQTVGKGVVKAGSVIGKAGKATFGKIKRK